MHIERMHKMQECLTEKAVSEFEKGIENVDTSEMGEVVDMIKDLAEAEYHSIISKAMKKADEEEEEYDKELLRSLKAEYGEETDNTTKTITIADNVSDYMADRILCHELVHVYSFSYGCDIDIETEEIIADFMSLYGRNIVYTADKIFDLLEWKYG